MLTRFIALGLLLVGIAAAVVLGVISSTNRHKPPPRFSAAAWKGPVDWCTRSQRGEIVDDLVTKRLRRGMPMRAARALLGAPDAVTDYGTWVYDVDFEDTGFMGTCVTLALSPKAGRLERAEVIRDS